MLLTLFALFLLAYIAMIVVIARYQHVLVFHPGTRNAFLNSVDAFEIVTTETADGLFLKGFYAAPVGDKPVIIYFHGNANNASDRLFKTKAFLAAGYGFLLTEYRGYGGNPGKPGEDEFYTDGRAWLAFLKEHHINPERFVYYGESLGTGVAIQLATETPPKALILEAPYTSVTDVGAHYYPFLPVRYLAKYHFNSLSKVQALTMPVLIYHGERDRTVPYRFGQQLFDAIPSQHKIFAGFPLAGHADLYHYAADAKVLEFLHDYAP